MSFSSQNHKRDWYDTAQVCINGHVINYRAKTEPEHNKSYCSECGAKTIISCPKCKAKILGELHSVNYFTLPMHEAPKFCSNCGSPYPWTESGLKAAHDLANEIKGISKEERKLLNLSIDELVRDTPQTNVAIVRFRKMMSKVGPELYDAFKKILIDIISEAAKRAIFEQQDGRQ
ncbi:MAG: DUF2321 domain-containing protein [Candidatus Thorarchaeota archaeon]